MRDSLKFVYILAMFLGVKPAKHKDKLQLLQYVYFMSCSGIVIMLTVVLIIDKGGSLTVIDMGLAKQTTLFIKAPNIFTMCEERTSEFWKLDDNEATKDVLASAKRRRNIFSTSILLFLLSLLIKPQLTGGLTLSKKILFLNLASVSETCSKHYGKRLQKASHESFANTFWPKLRFRSAHADETKKNKTFTSLAIVKFIFIIVLYKKSVLPYTYRCYKPDWLPRFALLIIQDSACIGAMTSLCCFDNLIMTLLTHFQLQFMILNGKIRNVFGKSNEDTYQIRHNIITYVDQYNFLMRYVLVTETA
nr:unnamed protein product [Callosobruchus analis]